MTHPRNLATVNDLLKLPAETPWAEFKQDNANPCMIGKLISALSNSARLDDRDSAFVLWGVQNGDRKIVGTAFEPSTKKHKKQPLELWLKQQLRPDVDFSFESVDYQGKRLVLLTVSAAATRPVEFDRVPYIRIGSATSSLSDHGERLRRLWAKLQFYAWESGIAADFLSGDEILSLLDYGAYFKLTDQPRSNNGADVFERLAADGIIREDVDGRWSVTNLGAILFANNLADFSPSIARKAVRLVVYDGIRRASRVTRRIDGAKGYASGFRNLMNYIDLLLPRNEYIREALRKSYPLYPPIAIRELVANALIHQDMTISGAGPVIEIFSNRMEITNPGKPLVEPQRFLDLPPRSRNEALSSLMRRMGICEEMGGGIDSVIESIEEYQLPPPDFRAEDNAVRVVLFAPRGFDKMTPTERVRACYQHTALKYSGGENMENSTLCARFGISGNKYASQQASTVIRKTLEAGLIRLADESHPRKGYVPYWAS